MSLYEIITVVLSSICTVTSIVSAFVSVKAKKEVKNDIHTFNMRFCQNSGTTISNDGTNDGVIAGTIQGGVNRIGR